ncbi:MAG: hypothetical protein ACJ745_25280, partial [Actinomycetes bacterium]
MSGESRAEQAARFRPEQAAEIPVPTLLLAGGDSPKILKTGIDLVPAVLARLATSTASPAMRAMAAARTPSEATSQPDCPLDSAGGGAGIWAGVPLGMEERSRSSCRTAASMVVGCDVTGGRLRQVSPAWRSVASRRAFLPS